VWTAATAGAIATAAAMFLLPWADYGQISIPLEQLPNSVFYMTTAVVLQLFVGWVLLRWTGNRRLLFVAGATLEAATIISAIVAMVQYDNGGEIFSGPVPLVIPSLGLGGPVAIAAAMVSGTAMAVALRASKPSPINSA
jgi:hypothetical protein